MVEVQTAETHNVRSNKATQRVSRDARAVQVKNEVKEILSRSHLKIEKQVTGSKNPGEGPNITFEVSGKGVETPFNRYYLNKKLDRLNERFGVTALLRRKDRGVDQIKVDVYLTPLTS